MTTDTHTPETSTVPKGYWKAASGALIPADKVKPIDKARNQVVKELALDAKAVSEQLRTFKLDVMAKVAAFIERSAAEYEVQIGGTKGNVSLISYDGQFKIVRQVQDTLAFDERLQVAKAIIDECVHVWAKGANKNIQALINHAFQVDKEGKVNTGRVLSLRQLQIDDPKWQEAMAAIADSMKTISSKSYVRFYERDEATGAYIAIPLDVSAL